MSAAQAGEPGAAFGAAAARVWAATGGAPEAASRLTFTGPRAVLPSSFDVTGLATASVAAAALAAAQYHGARNAVPVPAVRTDSRAACAAFAAEGLFTPEGWSLPAIWDPLAGNYRARDGWIRLHTNYAYHRAAAARALRADDRDTIQAVVARRAAEDVEEAVVAAGGCAAVMHDRDSWLATPGGAGSAAEPAPAHYRAAAAGLAR